MRVEITRKRALVALGAATLGFTLALYLLDSQVQWTLIGIAILYAACGAELLLRERFRRSTAVP